MKKRNGPTVAILAAFLFWVQVLVPSQGQEIRPITVLARTCSGVYLIGILPSKDLKEI